VLRPYSLERRDSTLSATRAIGFFNTYRQLYPVSRDVLRDIAGQFQNWVKNRSERWGAPILEAPQGRRDDFVEPYFRKAKPDQIVVILKAREPARILIAIGNKKDNRWHLQIAQRWVNQYNFCVNDQNWGRLFVRLCPYLPFSARVCLNLHHWLAQRLRNRKPTSNRGPYRLGRHEQCLERRKEATSHRTGEARMAFTAHRASHWCP
jgi:hypothetical protein